jgi:uncharacterized RDD family membrane protein YckC
MSQPAGWYTDPRNPDALRYWDGVLWTEHTTPRKSPTADGSAIGRSPQPPAYGSPPTTPMDQPRTGWPEPPETRRPAQGASGYPPAVGGYDRPPAGYGYGAAPQAAWHSGAPTAPDGARLADWWQRLLARLLDNVIVGLLVSIVGFPWIGGLVTAVTDFFAQALRDAEAGITTMPDQSALNEQLLGYVLPLTLTTVVIGLLYETFFLVRSGATPGKKVLGITVRRVHRAGPLTVADALKRQSIQQGCNLLSLVPLVSLVTLVLQPLDNLWLLWDARRQALHDKVADTLVVRVPKIR